MRGTAGSPVRGLRLAALVMFGVIAAPALASFLILELREVRYEELGKLIALASRQRMLSDRIASLAEPMVYARDAGARAILREQILEAAALLERSHEALIHRGGRLGLRGNLSAEARSLYLERPEEIDSKLRAYLDAARQLASLPEGALVPEAAPFIAIQGSGDALQEGLERVVDAYANEQAAAATFSHRLALAVSIAVSVGIVATWFGIFQPMLRRLRREHQSLEESESRLRALVDGLPIAEWDPAGRILYASPRARDLSGLSPGEFVGKHWREFSGGQPGELGSIREAFRRALESGEGAEVSYQFQRADGSLRHHELALQPFRAATGETRVVSVTRDLTDRWEVEMLRRLTTELRETTADLNTANRELDEFASVAAHDLQEPLRKVVSFSQLLKEDLDEKLPEAAEKDLEFIVSAARRMQQLIRDLLRLARTSTAELKRERVAVDDCVDRALESLELRFRETGARLTRDPLPEVMADPTFLTAIYQNLIANALKFQGGAPPVIHLSAERSTEGWILGVRDHGIGIPPEHAGEIFRPFRRLQPRQRAEETGIGLATCLKAARRHGGWIRVESPPDGGAHFRFSLGAGSDTSEGRE